MLVEIVMKLSTLSLGQLLLDSDIYTSSMTGNTHFTGAEIVTQVTATKTATTQLRTTINAPVYPSKVSDIKKYQDTLIRELNKLKSMVEYVANSQLVLDIDRVGIVESAGMTVKGHTNPATRVFNVVCGVFSGSVVLTAKGGVVAHEWQYTSDVINFTNRISIHGTTVAYAKISGLTKNTEYAFFHCDIVAGVETDWDTPVILMVV